MHRARFHRDMLSPSPPPTPPPPPPNQTWHLFGTLFYYQNGALAEHVGLGAAQDRVDNSAPRKRAPAELCVGCRSSCSADIFGALVA
jgi:hypothetical protein